MYSMENVYASTDPRMLSNDYTRQIEIRSKFHKANTERRTRLIEIQAAAVSTPRRSRRLQEKIE